MKNKEKTHYQILGIKKSATIGEIKVAYRKRIAKTHPDKNTDSDHDNEAWRINLAYHTLKDPKRRAEYDRKLVAESLLNQTIAGVKLSDVAENFDSFVHRTAYNAKSVGRQFAQNLSSLQKTVQNNLHQKLTQKDEPLALKVLAWQAMLGDEILFNFDNKTFKIKLPKGVQTGALLKLQTGGQPLLVQIVIITPSTMTNEQKVLWQALKASYQDSHY